MADKKDTKATITIEKTRYKGALYIKGQAVTGAVADFLIDAGKAKEAK